MESKLDDCIFCKIVAGEIPAEMAYRDESVCAIADIHPQAPTHLLIMPRSHIASLSHAVPGQHQILGHLLEVAAALARQRGLADGFRVVINTGNDGGQTVGHLHLHLLGGRPMHWPPG